MSAYLCAECGSRLRATVSHEEWGTDVLVQPCEECIKNAKEEARIEAEADKAEREVKG
jgi:hypothetical protein